MSKKRDLVLGAAKALFLRNGYSRTSMEAVAKQCGVSKATLYGYFRGKEELFITVIEEHKNKLRTLVQDIIALNEADAALTLKKIGTQFLTFILNDDSIAVHRVVIGEARQFPKISQEIARSGGNFLATMIAEALSRWSERGVLCVPRPLLAAKQFVALAKGDIQLNRLLDDERQVSEQEIAAHIEAAVSIFLTHYEKPPSLRPPTERGG